jgi:hypothetical protein
MSAEIIFLILGTILSLGGFLRWPKHTGELLGPRFIVPLMLWAAIFGQFIVAGDRWDNYEKYHLEMDGRAMGYACLCIIGFWLGFVLPFGRWISKLFSTLPSGLYVSPSKLRWPGLLLCGFAFGVQLIFNGSAVFYAPGGLEARGLSLLLNPTIGRYLAILVDISGIIGAVMVGFSWPAKGERNLLTVGTAVVGLLLAANVFMSRLSRASGLPFILAYGAASIRFRKSNIILGIAVLYIVAASAHTGLTGREVYGHYPGSYFFYKHFFGYSVLRPMESLEAGLRAGDSFTSLAVTMYAVDSTDIHELTRLQWMANLLPVPRAFGLPTWTTDPSRAIGTMYQTNPFWFTLGLFGDTYAHFRYWGFIWFIPIGVAFRMIHELVNKGSGLLGGAPTNQDLTVAAPTYQFINLYALLMVMNYGALMRGLFNTYRSLEVTFLLQVALLVGFLFLVRIYRGPEG